MLLLPIKSLLICRCVCTTFKEVISDQHFAKLHFERATSVLIRTSDPKKLSRTLHLLEYERKKLGDDQQDKYCGSNGDFVKPRCKSHVKLEPIFKLPLRDAKFVLKIKYETKNGSRQMRYISRKLEDNKFDVVNSCNGIICFRGPKVKDRLVVYNPIMGEYIRFPEDSKIKKIDKPEYCNVGFGFKPKTNEYKVIRMWRRFAQIHTVGTPTWRNIGLSRRFFCKRLAFPTYLNRAVHWLDFFGWKLSILRFNFECETFKTFPSPPLVFEDYAFTMGELRGCLCMCDTLTHCYSCVLWIMEKYSIGESWTKAYNIRCSGECILPPKGLYFPIKHFKIGDGILMCNSWRCFIYYESKKGGFKYYEVHETKSKFEVIPHIPSLISLKDIVKGESVVVLNVYSR